MAEQQDGAVGGGVIVPVNISDKLKLVEEIQLSSPPASPRSSVQRAKSGRLTWVLAALGLPAFAVLVLVTLFLLAEPYELPRKLARYRSTAPTRRNIFVIDINTDNYPSQEKLSILEKCVKRNTNSEIYQITLNQFRDQPRRTSSFEKLKKKYSNFHFMYQNSASYFRGSIFEGNTENNPPKIKLFKAQLLILWKYAGLVLSPNWIPQKSLEKTFVKDYGNFLVGGYNGEIGVMSVSAPCNARLFDIMKNVEKTNSSTSYKLDVFDKIMLKNKKGITKLGFPQLCNNNTLNEKCVLMEGSDFSGNSPVKKLVVNDAANEKQVLIPKLIKSEPVSEIKIGDEVESPLNFLPGFFHRYIIFS